MDDDIGGVSDQGFIVGHEEHGPGPGLEKLLQKLKGLQVQIIGRLIQQEQLRLLCQKPGQLELHPLAAGQLPQKAVPAGQIRREAQGGQKDGFLWRGEDRALTPEGADRLLQGLGRQLLGQISHPGLAPLDLPGPLGIIGNERFIKKSFSRVDFPSPSSPMTAALSPGCKTREKSGTMDRRSWVWVIDR